MSTDYFRDIDDIPDSFSYAGRENVLMLSDLHAMDALPGSRQAYVLEVCDDINEALDRYSSDTVVFNGDTGSSDHIGTILQNIDADEVIFVEGDEDRKIDEERDYIGWARLLDMDSDTHFDTETDYSLNGEHVRLDEEIDLPGSYPVHVQHFPRECRDSTQETGVESFWFSDDELFELYGYAESPTTRDTVQAAFHGHVHGYNTRTVGLTALVSLGPLRDSYVTDERHMPKNSIQAVSFGEDDFEIVHQDRESGELVESQKFRETKKGFVKTASRGKDHLHPLERFKWSELPPDYRNHLQRTKKTVEPETV